MLLSTPRGSLLRFQSTRPMRGATIAGGLVTRCAVVSIHAPHAGRDLCYQCHNVSPLVFQSTRPMRGATRRSIPSMRESMFQSTRPMRGATVAHPVQSSPAWFQSTRPMRGATRILGCSPATVGFQSTRPMRGATLCDLSLLGCGGVSIHAPHAGRDRRVLRGSSRQRRFNPRAPCGARPKGRRMYTLVRCFNPRAPCGARRRTSSSSLQTHWFQSTRPMRGATVRVRDCRLLDGVSIHAPHAGRDNSSYSLEISLALFQSTRPMRGATTICRVHRRKPSVSIHAPRVGRDVEYVYNKYKGEVSIHAPRVGRDLFERLPELLRHGFNPRAPCGARHVAYVARSLRGTVSIHAPRVGRDRRAHGTQLDGVVSIHAPRVGRDMWRMWQGV